MQLMKQLKLEDPSLNGWFYDECRLFDTIGVGKIMDIVKTTWRISA